MTADSGHGPAPSPRRVAVDVLVEVLDGGRSLDDALGARSAQLKAHPADQSLVRELVSGVLRWYWSLAHELDQRLEKPLRRRDRDLRALLLLGLYQLRFLRMPRHAAVDGTVRVCEELSKHWAKGLVNAVLRAVQRTGFSESPIDSVPGASHPAWLLQRLRSAWPQLWPQIVCANNEKPPMTLRVNQRQIGRTRYLAALRAQQLAGRADPRADAAITLDSPCEVARLPGFSRGWISVQDVAAQWVAPALEVRAGMRVLDACAAPGGKAAHTLELEPEARLLALDIDPQRCMLLEDTFKRLQLRAAVRCADASDPQAWWDGQAFDRILLDAPCSSTGVIRRHPDIKHLRRPTDIAALAARQRTLLDVLWPLLRPGGRLLYVTCSVLPEENQHQIEAFLSSHTGVECEIPQIPVGCRDRYGIQVLPGVHDADGFFYCGLVRRES